MRHARYYIGLAAGALLGLAAYLGLVFVQVGAPTESSRWTYEACAAKQRIALAKPSPKILIMAGSSGHFSISAEMIEKETGVPAANLACHVGLGLDYMLRELRSAARPGDIVLLALEYGLYGHNTPLNGVLVDHVLARDPGYLRSLDPMGRARILFALTPDRLVAGLRAKVQTPVRLEGTGYDARTLSPWGDETVNVEAKRLPSDRIGYATLWDVTPGGYARPLLQQFAGWCRANHVRLLATFPAVPYGSEKVRPPDSDHEPAYLQLYRDLGIATVGTPRDFLCDSSLFYDTCYHLTTRGRAWRTERTIRLLLPFLNDVPRREGGAMRQVRASGRP